MKKVILCAAMTVAAFLTAYGNEKNNANSIDMVFVKGGTVSEGIRDVKIDDFHIMKYEVTQGLWKAVMGNNPSYFSGNDNLPVENVRMEDIQAFIGKLNGKTGKKYRLPSSREWTYAAQGGNKGKGFAYSGSDSIGDVAWYWDNSGGKTHPVGTKKANTLGIHDMSGNVWEAAVTSGGSTSHGGGSCGDAKFCVVATPFAARRGFFNGSCTGFRLALDAPPAPAQNNPGPQEPANMKAIDMVLVKGGTFMMGCTEEQGKQCKANEKPARKAAAGDFYISKYEVTRGLWKAVMGAVRGDDNLPVAGVTWVRVQAFISELNRITGKQYRLPSETEWEFAARGGKNTKGYRYSGSDDMDEVAWHRRNSGEKAHPVGTRSPNELGIHDMSGNVWEWTNDTAASTNSRRAVYRGGSFAQDCRVSVRNDVSVEAPMDDVGFRLVMPVTDMSKNAAAKTNRVPNEPANINVPEMVLVKGGTFTMGCTEGQGDGCDKYPAYKAAVSDLYVSKYEATQGLWKSVMDSNPSESKGDDNLPVTNVSWDDVQEFLKKLNGKTGKRYRLLTSQEWEYAARGGNKSEGYEYSGGNDIDRVAWYDDNSGGKTHPVGTRQANELGIHDMSGNVSEWTESALGDDRIYRNSGWRGKAQFYRVSYWTYDYPSRRHRDLGFRLALDP